MKTTDPIQVKKRRNWLWPVLCLALLATFIGDLLTGSSALPLPEVWKALTGGDVTPETRTIVLDIRLSKALVAFLAGAAVSVSGLLMQTLFRNPLAGPYVLGISSGASLGAALYVLGAGGLALTGTAGNLLGSLGLAGAAWIGCALLLALISSVSHRIKDIMIVLILGMMLSSGIDALVQLLQYSSDEAALKSYIIWTMGSLSTITPVQLGLLAASVLLGLLLAVRAIKPLNLLLLGESQARSMGLNLAASRRLVYTATILLAGTVTAFCGPLGFIGLAVPHLVRFIFQEADHRILVPGTILTGSLLMLCCDLISKAAALPVNVLTSLLGIPVVIGIVLKNRNL